jgi:hypothetical protein
MEKAGINVKRFLQGENYKHMSKIHIREYGMETLSHSDTWGTWGEVVEAVAGELDGVGL